MKNLELKIKNLSLLFGIVFFAFGVSNAQSIRQDFPTPITTNEISGKVPARDIGDPRLTNYFYAFNGVQGDVFINVQTKNFNGDIEIFTVDNLKSLTKITIYADISENETGRVVYLRKPEKLILRIQGRTPNDDDATYHIKFAGSFAPLPVTAENSAPELPEVKSVDESGVRVNSVGTIIEVKPKPTPLPKEAVSKTENKSKSKQSKKVGENKEIVNVEEPTKEEIKSPENTDKTTITIEKNAEETTSKAETEKEITNESQSETSAKIVINKETDDKNIAVDESKKEDNAEVLENKEVVPTKTEESPTEENVVAKPETPAVEKNIRVKRGRNGKIISKKVVTPPAPNPLENIKLVVLLKDGTKIEHQMSDVLRFNIINGILTIITKDGKTERHSILDVERTIIE